MSSVINLVAFVMAPASFGVAATACISAGISNLRRSRAVGRDTFDWDKYLAEDYGAILTGIGSATLFGAIWVLTRQPSSS
jgi:hypothetical protein